MWSTTELDQEYVDRDNECGLGQGTMIKATLVFDCFRGDSETSAELAEVLFARVIASDGSSIYSRLGCNVIQLDSQEWNAMYSFVCRAVSESWSEVEPKALAADPVRYREED